MRRQNPSAPRLPRVVALASLVSLAVGAPWPTASPATSVSAAGADAAPAYEAWTTPLNLGPVVNSPYSENHPHISRDGLSLFFHSDRPGGYGGEDIWVSERAAVDEPWRDPVNLGPAINTTANDRVPCLFPGQQWLVFGSTRPGYGGLDLWIARRFDTSDNLAWEPAINIGSSINTASDEDGAVVFEDELGRLVLYLTSTRPGGLGGFDLYQSVQGADGTFGMPVAVQGVNTSARDTRAAVSRDGLELFLTTDRPGSLLLDVWTGRRDSTEAPWNPLARMDINSAANDGAPALSFGRSQLYLYSNRPGGLGGNDLYLTERARRHGRGQPQP